MIKYCLEKWDKNKSALRRALLNDKKLPTCEYKHLVELAVMHILNDSRENDDYDCEWDVSKITEIDNGGYQGTLLYLIPSTSYQPSEYEYLMAYVGYGSCSGCDTLQRIQRFGDDEPTPIKDYMTLCLDIVSTIIKPYNTGWRGGDSEFEAVKWDEEDA